MSIKVSFNIKYDYKNLDILDDYYASGSHCEIIKGVINGVLNKTNIKAHIAYGPYGSGKSYISSILTGILGNLYKSSQISNLARKFSNVDTDIERVLNDYIDLKSKRVKYIPVILNGYEGGFSNAIANSIAKALYNNKIKVKIPGASQRIIEIINLWKRSYIETYNSFISYLNDMELDRHKFIDLIQIGDQEAINNFILWYPKLTSGSELNFNTDIRASELIDIVCEQLKIKNIGLFLVYDEFGRYLQNLNVDTLNIFMQEMQNLAEYANDKNHYFTALFITHKPIGFYFNILDKSQRMEFAKVEKRFNSYEIKNDYTSFINITSQVVKDLSINKDINLINKVIGDNYKYNVFESIVNDTELENIIIDKLYPLHPITTFILPKISSIFGQNERTLFTFLNDESQYGLTGFISRISDQLYYPDYLVDYFFINIDPSYIDEVNEYKTFMKNLSSLSTIVSKDKVLLTQRVYKFIMLWKLINGNSYIKSTTNFISYALNEDENLVEDALQELFTCKLTRFNTILNRWEIFEGSSYDIDKDVSVKLATYKFDNRKLLNLLENQNPYRYVYADSHNNHYEITRFACVQFNAIDFGLENQLVKNCDVNILVSFHDISVMEKDVIHIHYDYDLDLVFNLLKKLTIIYEMLHDEKLLREYNNLEIELDYEKDKLLIELNKFYELIFSGNSKCYFNDKQISLNNVNDIGRFLSELFDNKFNRTLHINNDQINMYQLTKIQYNALIRLFDEILKNNSTNLPLNGSQPIDLSYYSLFVCLAEEEDNARHLEDLRTDLIRYLQNNPEGSLNDLVNIAINAPYGLRPLVATILTFGLISNMLKDIMFFANGNYISSIDADKIVQLLEMQPNVLHYSYNDYDFKNRPYLEKLNDIFPYDNELTRSKSLGIRVCSGIYNWYLNLPVITQQLIDMNTEEIDFMEIVAGSRINPIMALTSLNEKYNIEKITEIKNCIDRHFNDFISNFRKNILLEMKVNNFYEWAESQLDIVKKTNRLARIIISDKNIDIIEYYAKDVENIDIKRFTKSSFDSLRNRILSDYKNSFSSQDYQTVTINGKQKHIQKVVLSNKAGIMLQNLKNTVNATKKYLTEAEVEQIMLEMLKEYVK